MIQRLRHALNNARAAGVAVETLHVATEALARAEDSHAAREAAAAAAVAADQLFGGGGGTGGNGGNGGRGGSGYDALRAHSAAESARRDAERLLRAAARPGLFASAQPGRLRGALDVARKAGVGAGEIAAAELELGKLEAAEAMRAESIGGEHERRAAADVEDARAAAEVELREAMRPGVGGHVSERRLHTAITAAVEAGASGSLLRSAIDAHARLAKPSAAVAEIVAAPTPQAGAPAVRPAYDSTPRPKGRAPSGRPAAKESVMSAERRGTEPSASADAAVTSAGDASAGTGGKDGSSPPPLLSSGAATAASQQAARLQRARAQRAAGVERQQATDREEAAQWEAEAIEWTRSSLGGEGGARSGRESGQAMVAAEGAMEPCGAADEVEPGVEPGMEPGMEPGVEPGVEPGAEAHRVAAAWAPDATPFSAAPTPYAAPHAPAAHARSTHVPTPFVLTQCGRALRSPSMSFGVLGDGYPSLVAALGPDGSPLDVSSVAEATGDNRSFVGDAHVRATAGMLRPAAEADDEAASLLRELRSERLRADRAERELKVTRDALATKVAEVSSLEREMKRVRQRAEAAEQRHRAMDGPGGASAPSRRRRGTNAHQWPATDTRARSAVPEQRAVGHMDSPDAAAAQQHQQHAVAVINDLQARLRASEDRCMRGEQLVTKLRAFIAAAGATP